MKFEPIYTKLAGVTSKNDDGASRQEILKKCEVGEELILQRDPYNKYDENAIEVINSSYNTLGYINKKLAKDLAPLMDAGLKLKAEITDITGGDENKSFGCNIVITLKKEAAAATWMDALEGIQVSDKKEKTKSQKQGIGFWGCLGALVKLVFLFIVGLVLIIIVVGILKGW